MNQGTHLRGDGRVVLPNSLRITLQRCFPEDWQTSSTSVPRSYGRLRFTLSPDQEGYAIPILPDENVWVGLEAPAPPSVVKILVKSNGRASEFSLTCPPNYFIKGIPIGRGFRALVSGDFLELKIRTLGSAQQSDLRISAHSADRVLDLVTRAGIGRLDRRNGYSGQLLP